MKKKFFAWVLVAMAGLMVSCSEDEPNNQPPQQDPEEVIYYTPKRTISQAIEIAQMAVQNEQAISRSERTVKGQTSVKAIVKQTSRSESDTLLYVVQYEDNRGFALISVPTNVEPVIALIDYGSFEDETLSNNEGFQFTLDAAKEYVSQKGILDPDIPEPIIPKPITPAPIPFYDVTINPTPKKVPTVKVTWGQGWPENMYASNHYAGCGPVAIAQILSVHELPTFMKYTFNERKNEMEFIDWAGLKKHIGVFVGYEPTANDITVHNSYYCNVADAIHVSLGSIIRQIGLEGKASYEKDGTGLSYSKACSILKNYLSGKRLKEWNNDTQLFNDMVNAENPVAYIQGFTKPKDGEESKGHAWVADGTWSIGTEVWHYVYNFTTKLYEVQEITGKNNKYVHYNWGWNGTGNGYFLVGLYAPGQAYEYDDPYQVSNTTDKYGLNVKYAYIY